MIKKILTFMINSKILKRQKPLQKLMTNSTKGLIEKGYNNEVVLILT